MRYCDWCGARATETVVVEPAEFKTVKGVKTQTHREKVAHACARCARVEREEFAPPEVARAARAAHTRRWKAAQGVLPI